MDELLSKARFLFGEQPWQEWHWEAREYWTRVPRVIAFDWRVG